MAASVGFFTVTLLTVFGHLQAQTTPSDLSSWDPLDSQNLDLGGQANLTTHNDTIRVLVDNEFHVLVLKDLNSFTCYILRLAPPGVTSADVIQAVETQGIAAIRTVYRPAAQLSKTEVASQFGHRVGLFCLHNPAFLVDKAANTSPIAPVGR